ncbi:hypothetical protein [Periweissella ghanensis]|uniref:LysM domain-containing protein n=1 Tax=Periweissella ghanensis TaxID=467997 RepID=A0ABN8BLS0_9LACO|nr:hypothetical protein [Periweissella ghanensis]MCM0600906.1 LysM peptidoglycan-binding domain-containing protein [Periweissella ghanensis]CAH0417676.1 hypothetical protein WGH24286_00088 [Periweissella ghanensis]
MTQNNDEQKKQPWESSFTEETSTDESAAPSRTQFRKRSSRTAWIVSLLILAVVVLAAYPVVRYVESINSPGSSADEPTQTQISTSTPSKGKESADKSDKSDKSDKAAKDEQSKADASSQAAASSAAASSAASSQAAAQSAQAASTKAAQEKAKKDAASSSSKADASSSSQAGGQFDTVKVNGYRLALAHGLSLAQLQALNPGVDLNNVHVGESLRVSN